MQSSWKKSANNFLLLSFAVFGFSALIFQVVFAKKLVLLFGLTAPAIATVLAVYFSGLALGSFLFGGLIDRFDRSNKPHRSYRTYVLFFLLTGIYGLLTPFFFQFLNILIKTVNNIYPLSFSGFNFFAFVFSLIFLIFPAILIGGGFPVVNKLFTRKEKNIGKKVSLVYFVETFGSVLGVAAAGFWLIPSFGNNATIFLAAGLNIVVAAFLFLLYRKYQSQDTKYLILDTRYKNQSKINKQGMGNNLRNPLFLYVLFITGFLALALEVLYTKTLILFIGSSTYAFSLIVITFLLGIALGSWVFSLFVSRLERARAYFGLFLGLIGFWLFLTLRFFEKLPFWYLSFFETQESLGFGAIILSQSFLTFLVIFPATFLMGIVFPLGIHLARPHIAHLGRGVGKLYSANTIGGVLGSLFAGFLFLPTIGYTRTLAVVLVAYFVLGGSFLAREKGVVWPIKGATIFFFLFFSLFAVFSSPWGKKNLTTGVFVYAPLYLNYGIDLMRQTIENEKVLFYKEGLSNVAVTKRGPNNILKVNGKVDSSNNDDDLETMILTGILPMISHENPEDVLVIGLGSGITLGSVTQFDSAKNIDLVEIDPAIIEASEHFKISNNGALHDPRVKTILADGRNYLLLTDKKYDVISSQPSNIWVSGNANLFTKEYYQLAKSRLKENGLMLQWIQAYSLTPQDVRSVYKTFQEVFPQVYLFNSANSADMFLMGALERDGEALNFLKVSEKMSDPKIAAELARVQIMSPYEFLAYLVSEGERFRKFASSAEVNTDNKNFLEFSAPKSLYKATISGALDDVNTLRSEINLWIFGLGEGEELENLKKYFAFRKKLLPAQAALSEGRLFEAVENYVKVRDDTGIILPSVEKRIIRGCSTAVLAVRESQGAGAAQNVLTECEKAFGPIDLPL